MAREICLAGETKDLAALLKAYPVSDGIPAPLILTEMLRSPVVEPENRQDLLYFDHFDHKGDDTLYTHFASYTSGRIFHRHCELRWENQENITKVVYIGQEEYKPAIEVQEKLELSDPTPRRYFLFGKRLVDKDLLERIGSPARSGDFAVARIPRLLRYPAPETANRVQLVVYEYVDPDTGINVAFRFAELVGAE